MTTNEPAKDNRKQELPYENLRKIIESIYGNNFGASEETASQEFGTEMENAPFPDSELKELKIPLGAIDYEREEAYEDRRAITEALQGALLKYSSSPAWTTPEVFLAQLCSTTPKALILGVGDPSWVFSKPAGELVFEAAKKALENDPHDGFIAINLGEGSGTCEDLMDWLHRNGDKRSLTAFMEGCDEYLGLKGNTGQTLESFLSLPKAEKPQRVSDQIRFIERVWDLKEEIGALATILHDDNVPLFFQSGTAKGVVLFDLTATPFLSENVTTVRFDSTPHITSNGFFLMLPLDAQMSEAVALTARKRGWGNFSCSAIEPSAFFSKDLAEHLSALGSASRVENATRYAGLIYVATSGVSQFELDALSGLS